MRTDIVVMGIIGILAINLAVFFIARNRTSDKGLKKYLKKTNKE
jgi:hypothetical protein